MEIKIKRNNYKHLIQCIYLGNLVINEYRKSNEEIREYLDNLLASNLYYELLRYTDNDIVTISANRIDEQITSAKKKLR